MKTWTKRQYLTYILLFALLFVDFSRSLFQLVVRDLLDPSVEQIYTNQLRSLERVLFMFQWLGSFPIIIFILKLNRDRLQEMNIDRFYVFMLVVAGSIQLYNFPYNFFVIVALIYAVYILFDNRVDFGVVHRDSLLRILFVACILTGTIFCVSELKIGLLDTKLFDRFLFEIIPSSIYEEAMYRGVLYMFLMDLGVSKPRAFFIQAFWFSIKHISFLLVLPFSFWIILPILSLIYGYIVMRSKSLTLSAFAHLLYNTWVTAVFIA